MSSAPPRSPIPVLSELPLVLESPRIRLRPIVESDADAYFALASNPELPRMMTWTAHTSIDETRTWVASVLQGRAAGEDMVWAIEHEGAIAGCIGLEGIMWGGAVRHDKAELGYWLAPALWGNGLMTEAVQLAVRWGFETLGLHKIRVACFVENIGSRRVIEKTGFRFLCTLDDDIWRDGKWHSQLRFELLASEWADSTRTLQFRRG